MSREFEPKNIPEQPAPQSPVEEPKLPEVLHEEITLQVGVGPYPEGTVLTYHKELSTYVQKKEPSSTKMGLTPRVLYSTFESLTIESKETDKE